MSVTSSSSIVPVELVDRLALHELGGRIVSGVAEMSSFVAWWLALVAEFDRREGWAAEGARSCSQWLSWKCGMDGRTARAHVRVATQLAEGRLSYSKVRVVCRAATADNEEFLVGIAMNLTAAQLETTVAGYLRSHGEPLSLAADGARRERCGVRQWVDADGLVHTEVIAAPEDGALIELALEYGRDQLYTETGAAVRGATGRFDSLLWVLRRGLVNAERPGLDDESRYTMIVHVREGEAKVADDGRRLDLGRTVRTATRKQRRALQSMYPTCQFPGCEVRVEYCEFHHLDWWTRGGRSDLHVFRPLCRRHHHLVHEGGWRLVVQADGSLAAVAPDDGAELIVNAPPLTTTPVAASALLATNRAVGHDPVDDARNTLAGRWGGERMDRWALSVIVEHMLLATGIDLTVGGPEVDASLVRGSPPSPN